MKIYIVCSGLYGSIFIEMQYLFIYVIASLVTKMMLKGCNSTFPFTLYSYLFKSKIRTYHLLNSLNNFVFEKEIVIY